MANNKLGQSQDEASQQLLRLNKLLEEERAAKKSLEDQLQQIKQQYPFIIINY